MLDCDSDKAILILKNFKWDNDIVMANWFDQEEKLNYKLGIEFDPSLAKNFPFIKDTLRANN